MKKFFLIFAFSIAISPLSFGQTDSDYTKTVKELFKVSGTEESFQAAIKQTFVMFKQQYPNVESGVWEEFEKDFSSTTIDELAEMLIPVYKKYMTKHDLRKLIKFYQTPVGKKYAKNNPFIMQESMQIGQQWGMKLGQEFTNKLKEKGY